MKKIILLLLTSLVFFVSCSDDDSSDSGTATSKSSNVIRLELTFNGDADEAIVSYKIRDTGVVLASEDMITVTEDWSREITLEDDFNFIEFTAANVSFEGSVSIRAFVGAELVGSDTSSSAAVIATPFVQ